MATVNAPTMNDVAYSGACPAAHFHGQHTLPANTASGTVVRLGKLFAGTKVYDAHVVHANLGANTTLKLGFEYAGGEAGSDDDAFIAAGATTAAGKLLSVAAPVTLAYDAYLIATTGGAGVTAGLIDAVVTFEHRGK